MTQTAAARYPESQALAGRPGVTPRARLLMVVVIGVAILAPSQVRRAAAAVAVSPQFVSNLATVTLSMSGASTAHSTLAPVGKPVVQISGPASGPSQSYSAQNVRFEGSTLKVDVNFVSGVAATGLLGAGPGTYSVKICQVSCTGLLPIEDAGTFNVLAAPVSVAPARPTLVALGGTTNVTLAGSFARGASASTDSPALSVGGASTPDGSHLVVPVTTTASTPPGYYNLTVSNTDGSKDTCYGCVRVANFQLGSLSPAAVLNRAGAQTITVSGAALPIGTQLIGTLTPLPAIKGQDPIRTPATEALSVTGWSAAFDLADVAPGTYSLTLASEDDNTVGLCTCQLFVYVQAPPTLKGVTPASVGQGAKNFALTVNGTGLPRGATLSVPAASEITMGDSVWVDNQTLTTTVTVDPEAPTGKVDVTVTDPSQAGTYTCVGCFVINPRPRIVSMSPDTFTQGARSVATTLTGEQFNSDTALVVSEGVTIESSSFVDTSHLSLTISIAPNAKGGSHTITARNPDGSTSGAVSALAVRRLVTATVATDRTWTIYGNPVTLSGTVTYQDTGAAVADQTATLMSATTGTMQPLADVTTDDSGVWRYQVWPKANTAYQLSVTAVGGAPATSPIIKVVVSPRIGITSPKAGSATSRTSTLTITGALSPAASTAVNVYTRDGDGRVRVVYLSSDGGGRFTTTLSLPAGRYQLWVVSAATSTYGSAASPPITIYRQ